jgi:hypothetical protein
LSPRFDEQRKIEVAGKRLDTIMRELGVSIIDLLKFDVEGAEGEIFASFDANKVEVLIGELHVDLAKMTLNEMEKRLSGHKVKAVQVSPLRYTVFAKRSANI